MSEKLQKVLARVGLGSRRHMEEVIRAGRVSVNGKIATLGDRIEATDELRIDGRKVSFQIEQDIRRRVIAYYKPEGEICSRHDPENRPTVFDQLPPINNDRWVMVGRLDINSSGLLLFTNDGELANRLMHPSNQIEREYAVRVMGEVTPHIQATLTKGVELEDGPAKFESFSELGGEGINRWYQVVVKEGRNREVRRLFESQGLKVSRLLRTRYGTVKLPRELRTGRWIELDKQAINDLGQSVELRPRQGTGLYGLAKRRAEKMAEYPLPARREIRRHVRTPVVTDQDRSSSRAHEHDPSTRSSGRASYSLTEHHKAHHMSSRSLHPYAQPKRQSVSQERTHKNAVSSNASGRRGASYDLARSNESSPNAHSTRAPSRTRHPYRARRSTTKDEIGLTEAHRRAPRFED